MHVYYVTIPAELHIGVKLSFVFDILTSKIEERPFHILNSKYISHVLLIWVMQLRI